MVAVDCDAGRAGISCEADGRVGRQSSERSTCAGGPASGGAGRALWLRRESGRFEGSVSTATQPVSGFRMGAEDEVLVLRGRERPNKNDAGCRYRRATRFPTRSTVNRQPAGISVVAP